jgi:hypothetical protein
MIPVIAFAGFLFAIAYYAQRSAERRARERNLSKEVALFNAGSGTIPERPAAGKSTEERLHEMEKTINYVAESIQGRRGPVNEFRKESDVSPGEINELKEKLRTVFKEYDIMVSENYALRAKVKQLTRQLEHHTDANGTVAAASDPVPAGSVSGSKPALHLYDDTRLINLANPDHEEPSDDTEKAG